MTIARLLIVEDNPNLQRTLSDVLTDRADELRATGSAKTARELLESFKPELIVVDMSLEDGSGIDVIRAAQQMPSVPVAVAISGTATPEESFALAQMGVRHYLQKPLDLMRFEAAVESAINEPPDLVPHLRAAVGQVPIREMEEVVRETMVDEALARSEGSKRGAAKLLSVSRQLVQQILRRR